VLVASLGTGLLGWTACAAPGSPSAGDPGGGPATGTPQPPSTAEPSGPAPDADLPTPHRDFTRHFTDPLYLDEKDEFAPFGTDDSSDVLHRWVDRRAELKRCPTLRQMVGADEWSLEDFTKAAAPDLDRLLTGYAFTLLLLRGRIDAEGKKAVLEALRRTQKHYAKEAPRTVAVMLRDLEAFPSRDC
jgi:uncharacterized protein YfeS